MFGKKKKCPNCGKETKDTWFYCPYCGFDLKETKWLSGTFSRYRSIFDEIEKEFERIDKFFSSAKEEFFKFPKFEKSPKVSGISIVFRSGTGMKPQIMVKTYGDYKKLEPEIKKKLGIARGVEEVQEPYEMEEKPRKTPKITEEPKASIKRENNKTIIEINLPGVKSERDVDIKKLEQSIEVRGFADDKAYFKLIPIRLGQSIRSYKFKKGKLTIELE